MSDETDKSKATDKPKDVGGAPTKSGGAAGRVLGILVPALVAGAASFGGTRVAGAHHATGPAAEAAVEAPKPPGPTLGLDPFVFTVSDAAKKAHPMKVTIAVEFETGKNEEALKGLVPRIRDATLASLRTLTYEQATDAASTDKMRVNLLAAIKASGASAAQRVLITDLVVQ